MPFVITLPILHLNIENTFSLWRMCICVVSIMSKSICSDYDVLHYSDERRPKLIAVARLNIRQHVNVKKFFKSLLVENLT